MNTRHGAVLGLFPAIGCGRTGGIATSGHIAWNGIRSAPTGSGSQLFCYVPLAEAGMPLEPDALVSHSKPETLRLAWSGRWKPRVVLVWHIAMLKVAPFCRVRGATTVLFLHGIEAWRRHDPLTRVMLRRVNLFLANSESTWRRFVSVYPSLGERPHRIVHLGTGSPAQSPVEAPAEPPAVLMLGRLLRSEDYKGHREVIEAWPHVMAQHRDARLWIAGEGNLRGDLERLVREHKLEAQVTFWGRVTEEQKLDLIRQARCLAMPSRGEGFGLVYLEAMRLGRPCLVSDCDGGCEVVAPPDAGLAADPNDREAVASAIGRLLQAGSEWSQWSTGARRRYEAEFTATHFQERLLSALEPYLT